MMAESAIELRAGVVGFLRWRGAMSWNINQQRAMVVALLMGLSVSLTFLHMSLVPLSVSDARNVYAITLYVPVSLGALLLGTLAGLGMGLFAGAVLYIHTLVMPLAFLELSFITPFISMGVLSLFGLLAGILFAVILPRTHSNLETYGGVVLACFGASLVVRTLVALTTTYDPSLPEAIVQILIDTIVASAPCLAAHAIEQRVREKADDIGVREAFRISIFAVVLLAFMLTVTISYVSVTLGERQKSEEAIRSEVNYICLQIEALERRNEAFDDLGKAAGLSDEELRALDSEAYSQLKGSVGDVLNGYTMEQTGTVAIIQDRRILMTDDERLRVGEDVSGLLGKEIWQAIEASVASGDFQRVGYDGILNTGKNAGGYSNGVQVAYLLAAQQGDYTVMIIEPSSMVFRDRSDVMWREVSLTAVLLVAVFFVVTRLLGTTVARRIDQTNEAMDHITSGDLDVRCEVAGTREFKSLSANINKMVDALKGLIAEAEKRMEADLATGQAIQEGSLPKRYPAFPDVEEIDLYASMNAAKEVGGDFYDFFTVDADTVAFLVADVSGKGIPGALFMMVAKAEIQNCLARGMEIGEAMTAANKYLCAHNEAGMFVTVWAATLDWRTGHLSYVNAGHNFPLLRHGRGGSWEWLTEKSGLVMGLMDMISYKTKELTLEPGDELLLYTDGVNEAFNVSDEEYGNDRLEQFLAGHADVRPQEIVRNLREDVGVWAEGAEQSDDITILALEYKLD